MPALHDPALPDARAKNAIETRLRRAGVGVTKIEAHGTKGAPWLPANENSKSPQALPTAGRCRRYLTVRYR